VKNIIFEIIGRILGGEDPAAVRADIADRDAARDAIYEAERLRLQAVIDEAERRMAACATPDKGVH
jgi:hypothetical protein